MMVRRIQLAIGLALAVLVSDARSVAAHAGGIDIAFYGGFTPGATKCLRRITTAAKRCARRTYSLQRRCTDKELTGQACDRAQRDLDLDAALGQALGAIERSCTGGQLTELGLISFSDARNDLLQFCVRGEDVVSAVYSPLPATDPSPSQVQCALLTAELSGKIFAQTLQRKGDILDVIAYAILTPKEKRKMLQHAADQMAATTQMVAAKLREQCPEFEVLYGKSLEVFTATIEGFGDCALAFLYAQTAVLCPL